MAMSEQLIVGNVGNVYELRHVGEDNKAVVEATVAVTTRQRKGTEWVDRPTKWYRVKFWRQMAENVASHWKSGDRVMIYASLEMQDAFTAKDGTEVEPREMWVARVAGHDDSYFPSEQIRERKSRSEGGSHERPARKAAPAAAPAPKAAPKKAVESDDLDLDFGMDDDTEMPF